ncbi:MAG TPA: glycosyltransferase family 2 protein, partial [Phototrophicaceae bacterium]|nr:glycosyltransferase family 2 protein [Phototrophicaceae bacterium]
MRLTAIILTHDEAAHIAECIESVGFADRVLVFDSFSDDATVMIAKASDAEVIQRPFDNYANQRNAALNAARDTGDGTDWVLFVDADERISPALAREIQQAIKIEKPEPGYAGWRIPRHNYIFGKLTRGAGWYPDYQTRLLKIGAARYDPERQVHEVVQLDGELGTLTNPIIHYNYRDLAHFTDKQRRYSAYEAKILHDSGVRPKFRNFILQPYRQFKWRFIELKGYRDGLH